MHYISRRDLMAAMAACGLTAGSKAAVAQSTPDRLKLGVASYSLRKFSRIDAIAMIQQLHTRYVNIKEFHLPIRSTPDEVIAGRKEFEAAGLIILGGGNIPFQKDDEDDFRHKFEYARLAGMPLMVCAPTAQTLPKLEKYVKEYNIKIAIHNHGKTDKHFPSPQSALKAVNGMDPRCGLCIDVGHTAEYGWMWCNPFERRGRACWTCISRIYATCRMRTRRFRWGKATCRLWRSSGSCCA